ncbi:MAG TPA: hypothetical protein VK473_05320 [Terriglobales bacterium]|nr:hypothetical protein [Terriglobales bacterium]
MNGGDQAKNVRLRHGITGRNLGIASSQNSAASTGLIPADNAMDDKPLVTLKHNQVAGQEFPAAGRFYRNQIAGPEGGDHAGAGNAQLNHPAREKRAPDQSRLRLDRGESVGIHPLISRFRSEDRPVIDLE